MARRRSLTARLWLAGERCMAISLRAVGKTSGDRLMEKLIRGSRASRLHLDDPVGGLRPAGHKGGAEPRQELCRDRHQGRRYARGRWSRLQDAGMRTLLHGRCSVRQRHIGHAHLQGRDFAPVWSVVRPRLFEALALRRITSYGTALPSHPARRRRGDFAARSMSAWSASTCRSRCRSPIIRWRLGRSRASAISTSTPDSIRFYTKTRPSLALPSGVKEARSSRSRP